MTFIENYQNFLGIFESHLKKYLDSLPKDLENKDASTQKLIDISTLAVQGGGKRLRPYLVSLGYQIAKNESFDSKPVLDAALVAEIFHTFALVHDDIIDQSSTRRNQKTSHVLFNEVHKSNRLKGSSEHFGTSMAILTGDLLIAYVTKIISDIETDHQTKQNLNTAFVDMFINLILGQYQDVYQSFDPTRPSEEMIMSTLRWKSGEYTVEFPLKFGGILGNASEELLGFFAKFATPIGIAFQLRDDIFGIFSESTTIGKSNLSDIREGKNTLLIRYAMELANPDQISKLNSILGKQSADENELKIVQDILTSSGAKAKIEAKILRLSDESKNYILEANIDQEHKNILSEFCDFIISRDK